jgi:RND family efflux transporter MFP subunit
MRKINQFLRTKKALIILAFLIIFSGVAFYLLTSNKNSSENIPKQVVRKVVRGDIQSGIEASGIVQTANYVPITTSVSGIVGKVYVKEGDVVMEGQKIMEIDLSSEGQEALTQAWSSYLAAKNNLERAKNELLSKESAKLRAEQAFEDEKEENSYQSDDEKLAYKLAENTFLSAKTDYELQVQTISQAQSSLSKSWLEYKALSPTITAPDSGTIANIVVVDGMNISNSLSERTSTSVASIKKDGTPIVSLSISELDINNVKVGQKVNVELSSVDDRTFSGSVVGIDKIGESVNSIASYTVIVRLDESSEFVLPNMAVEAKIIVEEKQDVLIIPNSAITKRQGKSFVTVKQGNVQNQIEVKTGLSDENNSEILSGVSDGDELVLPALSTSGFTNPDSNQMRIIPGVPGGGSVRIERR